MIASSQQRRRSGSATDRLARPDKLATTCDLLHVRQLQVVRLNKALYEVKQSGRSWHELLSLTLLECNFEPCLVDPCLFRLILNDEDGEMLVVHVDDIKIVATKEITGSVVADLNMTLRIPYEVSWRGDVVHG